MVAKCVYDYTTTSLDSVVPTEAKVYNYSTGWEDKLVSVNTIGFMYDQWGNLVPYVINTNTVTYDGCNPTNVDGNVLTWTRGKMLSRFANVNFTYDATGKRVKKQQGSKESHYYYSGNKLAFEKVVQGNTEEVITYIYNGQGAIGFKKGNVAYYYQKNMYGDVTAIYRDATLIARYVYDAYGNCMVLDANGQQNFSTTFIGNVNPIRYRGYYYDTETGLYYCLTRYYNPAYGRFLSPDTLDYLDPSSINGLNLYAYCGNDPIGRGKEAFRCLTCKNKTKPGGIGPSYREKTFQQLQTSWFNETIGFSINYGAELPTLFMYFLVVQIEKGWGYSKAFSTGKPVTFYVSLPEAWWQFWEISYGVDINMNGYGFGVGLGFERSLTLHLGKNSLDFYVNALGRIGIKRAVEVDSGVYSYSKFEFNLPEILVLVAAAKYFPALIMWLLKLLGGMSPIPGI